MEKTPVTQLRALIDELVYLGLLARTTGDYPTVVLTEADVRSCGRAP